MGYGGVFKSVAKIAVTYIGFSLGGPLGAAVASAAFTGATGGSFKEALISGATAYVGAKISVGLSDASATATALEPFGGAGDILGSVGPDASFAGNIGELVNTAGAAIDPVTSFISESAASAPVSGITKFLGDTIFDPLAGATSTAFDVFNSVDNMILGDLLPDFVASSLVEGGAGVVAGAVGGLASLTMEQALNMEIPGLDQALVSEAGFTPEGVQALRNEARNALSQETFERLTGPEGVANPFGEAPSELEEFRKVIASGIERRNIGLGPDITEAQFRQTFDDPNIGQTILRGEEDLRKQSFSQEIEQAFPGDAFQPLDDSIIDSIIEERRGPAEEQIGRFGARGNLNPTGGYTANLFLQRQEPGARERVEELGSGVLGGYQRDIGEIRGRATEQAGGYRLGEDLFDVAPFSEERGGLIEERQGTLGTDVRAAIGGEPLFDVSGALRAGGRAQGVVSGRGQNQSFLDQIAARELGSTGLSRRGLGSRGSGAF